MGEGRIRTVFFGTPAYGVPTLDALAADRRFHVCLVVTQPDRPAGRGRVLQAPSVKEAALRWGLRTYQPATLRDEEARRPLLEAEADVFVVAAYGLVFGRRTLALPRHGCLNLHASLLPRYRGASPVAAAILNGDDQTGVSLMVMDAGLDTGPVVSQRRIPIEPDDTTDSLTRRLGDLAAIVAVDDIPRYLVGELVPWPQEESGASRVRPLVKADGWLDWSASAPDLERRVRAMWPWPRAWTTHEGAPVQVHRARVLRESHGGRPGELSISSKGVAVACGTGSLRLEIVQPAGGKPVPATAWVAGRRLHSGARLGETGAPPPPATPLIEWLESPGQDE